MTFIFLGQPPVSPETQTVLLFYREIQVLYPSGLVQERASLSTLRGHPGIFLNKEHVL